MKPSKDRTTASSEISWWSYSKPSAVWYAFWHPEKPGEYDAAISSAKKVCTEVNELIRQVREEREISQKFIQEVEEYIKMVEEQPGSIPPTFTPPTFTK